MDDLRERFRVLDDVPVPDVSARSRGVVREPVERVPPALRRFATAVIALVLALASFAILVRAFGSGSPPRKDPTAAGELVVEPGAPIPVGDGPNAVAVGAGAVWVSALPAEDGQRYLTRLDPATGDIQARIPVPALPTWEVGGGGLLVADGQVWVTGGVDFPERDRCCHAVVYRVDPGSNEVVAGMDLGPGFGADLWLDGSGLWALLFDETSELRMSVAHLDPVSLEELARIPLPSSWAKQVFAFDGSIWVHGNREGASAGEGVVPDVLFQIDPATNRFVGRVDLPSEEFPLAVDGTSIWQRTPDGVVRVDPDGSSAPVPLDGMEEHCCSHIASDGAGGVWVLARGDGPARVRVVHVTAAGAIDARGEVEVPEAVLGSVAAAFDPAHPTLWLAQYRRTVLPLRLVDG